MFHQQSVAEHTDGDMGNFEVYLSDFQPGTVCLGGSGATTGSSSNYIVAVGKVVDHVGSTSATYVTPLVETVAVDGVPGYTTYKLSVLLGAASNNVHIVYGIYGSPMVLPPAYQTRRADGGVDVGGVSPLIIAGLPTAEFDSWLTVGSTDGGVPLSTAGLDFDNWTQNRELSSENGMVAFFDAEVTLPGDAPGGTVVVAQVTVETGSCGLDSQVTLNFQGNAQDRSSVVANSDMVPDWTAEGVVFTLC